MTPSSAEMIAPEKGKTSLVWDIDSIFAGGASGDAFVGFRKQISKDLETAQTRLDALNSKLGAESQALWEEFILLTQDLLANLEDAQSFATCLISQNVDDDLGQQTLLEIDGHIARFGEIMISFEALSRDQSDEEWESLLKRSALKKISFFLNEMRRLARRKMDPELESLAMELGVNGYHAWNRIYDKMSGELKAVWKDNGSETEISLGQLSTKLADKDRAIRKTAFEKLTAAWESRANLAAMSLNAQAGFRLSVYKRRKWDSFMEEPLNMNRLSEKSLDAMWSAVAEGRDRLKPYIEAKKKLLGLDNFRWYDELAPVGESSKKISWDEAWDFIEGHVGTFSSDMKDFVQTARRGSWVEAENRPGKAGGGFCTTLNKLKQTRIFMTYNGSFSEMLTLAHELGHGFHAYVLKDRPFYASAYPMNLAETASIFTEILVTTAALDSLSESDQRLAIIDQVLQNTTTFFCNIRARFIFDKSFYAARKNGSLTPSQLSELMVSAQNESYGDLLAEDGNHPLFWASKLHFHMTDVPFYNFPYTFGFLFANGVYALAKERGPQFADQYRALLEDTGSMTAEDVAKKHLGVDIGEPDFWRRAVSSALEYVDEFVKLAGASK
ncbi:MAG: M3 family oligoendopeptidase [candidate division Zixibacteria bacterium]|nr:M3 family oligoendopeptidase [candidate division Zixibacteria bacterium]